MEESNHPVVPNTESKHQHLSQTAGAHNPWAAEAALEAHLQQGLVAVQALERQRVQKSSQDLEASQHL